MELYFLRHGIAAAREDFLFPRDFDRPLTKEGAQKMRRIAKAMKAQGLRFDLILSSPYIRARQTAEIAARVLKAIPELKLTPVLGADSTPRDLVRGLLRRKLPERVLLVGHEPLFSDTIAFLLGGHSDIAITLKKGGLAFLTVEQLKMDRCAALEWLVTPRQLCRMS
jgi:phosphohistidine phosphatase